MLKSSVGWQDWVLLEFFDTSGDTKFNYGHQHNFLDTSYKHEFLTEPYFYLSREVKIVKWKDIDLDRRSGPGFNPAG